jgi:hypothetical protein
MEAQFGITYGLEQFKIYTKDCPNIRPLRGYSPRDFRDWTTPLDVYYEDAVHTNPILEQNLCFWSGNIKPSGIICGDDYRPRFPDVMNGARRLSKLFERELIYVDFFGAFYLMKACCRALLRSPSAFGSFRWRVMQSSRAGVIFFL